VLGENIALLKFAPIGPSSADGSARDKKDEEDGMKVKGYLESLYEREINPNFTIINKLRSHRIMERKIRQAYAGYGMPFTDSQEDTLLFPSYVWKALDNLKKHYDLITEEGNRYSTMRDLFVFDSHKHNTIFVPKSKVFHQIVPGLELAQGDDTSSYRDKRDYVEEVVDLNRDRVFLDFTCVPQMNLESDELARYKHYIMQSGGYENELRYLDNKKNILMKYPKKIIRIPESLYRDEEEYDSILYRWQRRDPFFSNWVYYHNSAEGKQAINKFLRKLNRDNITMHARVYGENSNKKLKIKPYDYVQ